MDHRRRHLHLVHLDMYETAGMKAQVNSNSSFRHGKAIARTTRGSKAESKSEAKMQLRGALGGAGDCREKSHGKGGLVREEPGDFKAMG